MRKTRAAVCYAGVLLILAGCGSSLGGGPEAQPRNPYLGEWQGQDAFGQTMNFKLADDGRLTLRVSGRRGSWTKTGTYKIDTSHNPAHFDIKLQDREIKTICKLVDEKHLAFESIGSSRSRPKKFGGEKIVLKRK